MTTWYLFCDLEATGKETDVDEIIEAAFILVRADTLEEVDRFHALVPPTPEGLLRLVSNPVVLEMHTKNGLLLELAKLPTEGRPVGTAWLDEALVNWVELDNHVTVDRGDTLHLAGSGIANFDRPLIRRLLPNLDSLLHYAPIDVGVLKRTWKMWCGYEVTQDNANKNHRAMDDAAGHLNEARAFRERFKVVHETLQAKDWVDPRDYGEGVAEFRAAVAAAQRDGVPLYLPSGYMVHLEESET
jgi:oligoribonuclease